MIYVTEGELQLVSLENGTGIVLFEALDVIERHQ